MRVLPRRPSKRRLNLSNSIVGHIFRDNKVKKTERELSADLVHLVVDKSLAKKKRKSVKKELTVPLFLKEVVAMPGKENICNAPKVIHRTEKMEMDEVIPI